MPDPTPKPVDMATGHISKAARVERKQAEQSLYTGEKFKEALAVKNSPAAHKEFLRLTRLYKKVKCADALDEAVINRYCLETAHQQDLIERMAMLALELNDCEDFDKRLKIYEMLGRIETQMNRGKEFLLKYENVLFLNPMSRIRSIPKTPQKEAEKNPMESAGFNV